MTNDRLVHVDEFTRCKLKLAYTQNQTPFKRACSIEPEDEQLTKQFENVFNLKNAIISSKKEAEQLFKTAKQVTDEIGMDPSLDMMERVKYVMSKKLKF